MTFCKGKVGVIMGVANQRSIAAGISEYLHSQGADLAFSHLPDDKGRMRQRLEKVVAHMEPKLIQACNVNDDKDIESFFAAVKESYGKIDFWCIR